ncbi:hypothetical protein Fot_02565 [Forsythia ovata]|uniref:Uncharacterized protein n=1 Tax=Forsythia ovata TaxID=205694 RepID=A0ABD1X7R8_9LAMI
MSNQTPFGAPDCSTKTVWMNLKHLPSEVPMFFLTERDYKVIGDLYSFKGDFSGIICTDHLFVKHQLMPMGGEDVEVLEDDALRRAKKPRTAYSKSSHQDRKLGMFSKSSNELALPEEVELPISLELGHIKKVMEERPVDIYPNVLNMLPNPASKAAVEVDSYWTEE